MLYAIFSWLVILLILDYPGYSHMMAVMTLKAAPIEHLLVLLIFFYGLTDTKRAMWLLRGMVWLVIVGNVVTAVDALGIVSLGIIPQREDGRVGGTIGSSNEYGAFLAFFLPAIVALYWTETGWKKLFAGIGAVVSGLTFLMALSRGAIVGLVAGSIIAAWYLRASIPPQVLIRSGFAAVLLCFLALGGAFVSGYGDLLLDRFGLFGEGGYDASSGRIVIWGKALNSMLEHPLSFITGFGWHAYQSSIHFGFATHNTYLNLLYNLGIIGVGLFLLAAFNAMRICRASLDRADPEARPFIIAFVFGFLALLCSIFFGELHTSWLYVWAMVGISMRLAVANLRVEATANRASIAAARHEESSAFRLHKHS
jgi:Zn-dependent protease with chaperone function